MTYETTYTANKIRFHKAQIMGIDGIFGCWLSSQNVITNNYCSIPHGITALRPFVLARYRLNKSILEKMTEMYVDIIPQIEAELDSLSKGEICEDELSEEAKRFHMQINKLITKTIPRRLTRIARKYLLEAQRLAMYNFNRSQDDWHKNERDVWSEQLCRPMRDDI